MEKQKRQTLNADKRKVIADIFQQHFEDNSRFKKNGVGVLITDHNVRDTLAITDRAYILNEGEILASGPSRKVASDSLVRRYYLGEEFQL